MGIDYVECRRVPHDLRRPRAPGPSTSPSTTATSENYGTGPSTSSRRARRSAASGSSAPGRAHCSSCCDRHGVRTGRLSRSAPASARSARSSARTGAFDEVIGDRADARPGRGVPRSWRDGDRGARRGGRPADAAAAPTSSPASRRIEHLFDPAASSRPVPASSRPGGLLVLSCPNGQGFDVQHAGSRYPTRSTPSTSTTSTHGRSSQLVERRTGSRSLETITPGRLDAELVRKKALAGEFDLDAHRSCARCSSTSGSAWAARSRTSWRRTGFRRTCGSLPAAAGRRRADSMLTPEERQQFEEQGYVVVPGVLVPEQVWGLRQFLQRQFDLPAERRYDGDMDGFLFDVYNRYPEMRWLLFHEPTIDVLRDLLGTDFVVLRGVPPSASSSGTGTRTRRRTERAGHRFHDDDRLPHGGGGLLPAGQRSRARWRARRRARSHRRVDPFAGRTLLQRAWGKVAGGPKAASPDVLTVPSQAGDLVIFHFRLNHKATPRHQPPPAGAPAKLAVFQACSANTRHVAAYHDFITDRPNYVYLRGFAYPPDLVEEAARRRDHAGLTARLAVASGCEQGIEHPGRARPVDEGHPRLAQGPLHARIGQARQRRGEVGGEVDGSPDRRAQPLRGWRHASRDAGCRPPARARGDAHAEQLPRGRARADQPRRRPRRTSPRRRRGRAGRRARARTDVVRRPVRRGADREEHAVERSGVHEHASRITAATRLRRTRHADRAARPRRGTQRRCRRKRRRTGA